MEYSNSFFGLRDAFLSENLKTEFDINEIYKLDFHSSTYNLLHGSKNHYCKSHNIEFKESITFNNEVGTIEDDVHIKDVFVTENKDFQYYILKPKGNLPSKKVTFLFHGFNEKNWDKYLPWGKAICDRTQSTIVFFPLAFHMQRAPLQWSEKRKMFELSEQRKKKFPNIINSSLSNVAISMRLHAMPQRFIWSGVQTYYDVIQFIEDCKAGKHNLIDKDFTFNMFAYSIGGLLAEILKLSNHNNYFKDAKVALFCSGAVFNRITPVSKFIIDSEAIVALYSYLVEHFDSFLKKDEMLHHFMTENHFEGKVFHSMFEYQKMMNFREQLLKKAENHFYAIALKKDEVIPSYEVINTLKGANRNIDIKVDEIDFDFEYSHENPFPINELSSQSIDKGFQLVFDKIGDFYNG
jgi:hypothetical protein